MNVLIVLALVVGGVFVAAGSFLMFPPAGLVVGGLELVGVALFVDDGTPA